MRDEHGVAGFFEDLLVLVFVLAGALMIVFSAISLSEAVVLKEESVKLENLANRCIQLLVSELSEHHPATVVTVGSICSTRLGLVLDGFLDGRDFRMSIVMMHPEFKWLVQDPERSQEVPERACSASRLVNAITDDGYTAILAVRVVVW